MCTCLENLHTFSGADLTIKAGQSGTLMSFDTFTLNDQISLYV